MIDNTSDRPTQEITLTVNGNEITEEVEPRHKLSDFLRYRADETDVRVGCEHGACGACTVEVDGKNVKSCMLFAVQADGSEVLTSKALNDDDELGPIQEAFHENHALQCGFCTSGFIMATKELLEENPDPDREEIVEGLSDNICRCTGYVNIIKAVEDAADRIDTVSQATGDD
ncbi:(2Fe-2S)-binding protein [Natrarchaeobius oligotrophus]|uniref:(2Fe-2S)-binding protein n=1 Tax=Natrarchaeobius chitinivorans TaxID=1679083 RepID=A0A3N6M738_NATCH|nr:(2Fe-2S)-binding protein [Natrarchaeobius chitinivorans]RQG99418.1 (2Fe-2S)-binding protein [Natrarchaeobius chitinivorans]